LHLHVRTKCSAWWRKEAYQSRAHVKGDLVVIDRTAGERDDEPMMQLKLRSLPSFPSQKLIRVELRDDRAAHVA